MTWRKALIPLSVSGIFDFLGFIFSLFGIFGPILAGVATTAKTGSETLGVGATFIAGFFGGAALQAFGMIMAMVIGLMGWLAVGLVLLITNRRIFKKGNALWFGSVLIIDELPFINIIPALSYRTFRMYGKQIKADKKALAKYEEGQRLRQAQMAQHAMGQRNQQMAEQARAQEEQVLELEKAEVSRVAQEEQQAANDEIPEEEKLAA